MKRDKVFSICKKSKRFITFNQNENTQWLGNGKGLFCMGDSQDLTPEYLTAAAELSTAEVICTDFVSKDFLDKYNFADEDSTERYTYQQNIYIKFDDKEYAVFESERGTVFILKSMLSPFNKDEFDVFERTTESGEVYYAVKEGVILVGIIFEDNEQINTQNVNSLRQLALGVEYQYKRINGEGVEE